MHNTDIQYGSSVEYQGNTQVKISNVIYHLQSDCSIQILCLVQLGYRNKYILEYFNLEVQVSQVELEYPSR